MASGTNLLALDRGDDVFVRLGLQLPGIVGRVELGVDEYPPVGVVQVRVVRPVVVARPTGLLTVQQMPQVGLAHPSPVDHFPAPHQFVPVAGGEMGQVFPEHLDQCKYLAAT